MSGALSYSGHMLDNYMCDRKKKIPSFKKNMSFTTVVVMKFIKEFTLKGYFATI